MIISCIKVKVMFFAVRRHEIRYRRIKLSVYKHFEGTKCFNLQVSVSNPEY